MKPGALVSQRKAGQICGTDLAELGHWIVVGQSCYWTWPRGLLAASSSLICRPYQGQCGKEVGVDELIWGGNFELVAEIVKF